MAATPTSIPVKVEFEYADDNSPEEPLTEYRIEAFDGGVSPTHTYTTYGGWNIEGLFLCVYDPQGLKTAYAISEDTTSFRTVEVPSKESYVEEPAVLANETLRVTKETDDAALHSIE